jgi:hypothetical protein
MAEDKRDPSSHRTRAQMKAAAERETEAQKEERRMRMRARYAAMKKGLVKKGDGKDVGHKKPLSKGGSNDPKNLVIQDRSENRSWVDDPKTKGGVIKPGRRK